ncbi:hypothetical protein [Chitinophaga pinensis]|uniref:Uncharacterized protein n=1 Tax=Chitinophaga pinensis (strain ATCC 43595 / DSM 2588 / LMG 13176 / NBRC 15968 / NCIMB 11800 / UQM 2034) TaxID=485918 RepID=A0A979G8K6_CHIPD|nr:hypothetical protein [Chitinophaga pinensis]ACU62939.1 hypothetical protein Cpin_5510 [Chitinophaga pinensis DSM 2588]
MNTHADTAIAQKSKSIAGHTSRTTNNTAVSQLVSDRPEDTLQRKWQNIADNSSQVQQLKQQQQMADTSPQQLLQRRQTDAISNSPKLTAQLQQKSTMAESNVLQAKPAPQAGALRMVHINHAAPVQRREIPVIQTDLDALKNLAMPVLPDWASAASIVARQTLITQKRTALDAFVVEVDEKKDEYMAQRTFTQPMQSAAHIKTRLAALPGEITRLDADIAGGSAVEPARPPAGTMWGPVAATHRSWKALNDNLATNTATRISRLAEQTRSTADLPVADLLAAVIAATKKLDDEQALLNRRKKERYFEDVITSVQPVCTDLHNEGTWGHGPSALGVFAYTLPASLNGIDRCIDPFTVHIHKPHAGKVVRRAHVRGGEFDNIILYSGEPVGPGVIGGWEGRALAKIFAAL